MQLLVAAGVRQRKVVLHTADQVTCPAILSTAEGKSNQAGHKTHGQDTLFSQGNHKHNLLSKLAQSRAIMQCSCLPVQSDSSQARWVSSVPDAQAVAFKCCD